MSRVRPLKIECPICGKLWSTPTARMLAGKTCSSKCSSIKGYLAGTHKETGIELKLQELLQKLSITYETQKPLLGICVADILVRPNVVLFADGEYWHSTPRRIYKDNEVTKKLEKAGYLVLRLPENDIDKNIDLVKKKVLEIYEKRRVTKSL